MSNTIGWILYIVCILYSISGLSYSRKQVKARGGVSYSNLTLLFFTISISIIFAFGSYDKFNLIWIIPICLIIAYTPLSKILGNIMLYITFFLFKNKSEFNASNIDISKLDIEKILNILDSYSAGDSNSIIELCEKAIQNHKDYRLFSALSRAYRGLIPMFLFDFQSIPNNQIKQFSNYIAKSIQYGEQTLLLLLSNNFNDKDLVLTTYALNDFNDALTTNYLLISQIRRRKIKTNFLKKLNIDLKILLTKYYKQGYSKFDGEYQNYKENENLYNNLD